MVKGAAQLKSRFQKIPKRIETEARKVMEKSAREIVAQMKLVAPVLQEPDRRRRPGALRDSIDWTWGDAPGGTVSIGTVAPSKDSKTKITIYAGSRDKSKGKDDAFYARWVEFGTVKMPAQPYFWPTYRANRDLARRRIRAAVKKAFQKS